MGVHGLWQLISSTGKPVSLESLEGKVLAVDVSVWLHQLAKGMRDSSGNPLPHAHLHGLFTRICKLLHYKIKPVFVFDGGVPTLKKQTLAARRNKRDDAERTSSEMQQKILTNLIRSQALKEATGDTSPTKLPPFAKSKARSNRDAIYELPAMPESSKVYLMQGKNSVDPYWARQELLELVEDEYDNINDVDVESADFKALPADIQFEIITDMREYRKNYKISNVSDMPEDSIDFSKFQMAKLVKHNKLNIRLEDMRKEQNEKKAKAFYGESYTSSSIHADRIISDDSTHYILIQGLRKKQAEARKRNEKKVADIYNESSSADSNQFDELLFDSDEELRTMDFRMADQQQRSGQPSLGGPSTSRDYPNAGKLSCEIQSGGTGGTRISSRKGRDQSKSVYRPVIEIEPDSESSDNNSQSYETIKRKDHNTIDITEDTDLQRAIELSLTSQKSSNNTTGDNKTSDLNHPNSVDQEFTESVSNNSAEKEYSVNEKIKRAGGIFKRRRSNRLSGNEDVDAVEEEIGNVNVTKKLKTDRKPVAKTDVEALKQSSKIFRKQRSNRSAEGDLDITVVDSGTSREMDEKMTSGEPAVNVIGETEGKGDVPDVKQVMDDVLDVNDEDSESGSEDDFIEVNIDTDKLQEDSMFPADMFDVAAAEDAANTEISECFVPKDSSASESKKDKIEVSSSSDSEEPKTFESPQEVKGMLGSQDMDQEVEVIVGDDKADLDEGSSAAADLPDVVGENRAEIISPKIPDLVRDYQSMETNVRGMRESLAADTRQLELERGRQERLATSINDQMHAEAQELLQLFGIPYIVSPTEAEAQCAQLDSANLTQGTITDDSDIWLFGGRCVFKNFFNQQKHVECFRSVHIQSQLGLSRAALINIALLCGSDYTEGIQGVGPVTAMEILAEFPGNGIEGLQQLRSWWDEAQTQIKIPRESKLRSKVRELQISPGFPNAAVVEAYMSPTVDDSNEKFSWSMPNLELLRQFASQKLGWTQSKTDELVVPVIKRLQEKEVQQRISAFFQPENYMQPAKMKSKRLQKAVNQFLNPEEYSPEVKSIKESETNDTCDKDNKTTTKGKRSVRGTGRKKAGKKTESIKESEENFTANQALEGESLDKEQSSKKGTKRTRRGKYKAKDASGETKQSKYFDSDKKDQVDVEEFDNILPDRDSDADSDSDWSSDFMSDSNSSEEISVVQSSLDIEELLQLKMGRGGSAKATANISPKSSRVFESGLKVTEILNLDIGHNAKDGTDDALMEKDAEENDLDTVPIVDDVDEDMFKNEGGFIREEEDTEESQDEQNNKRDRDLDAVKGLNHKSREKPAVKRLSVEYLEDECEPFTKVQEHDRQVHSIDDYKKLTRCFRKEIKRELSGRDRMTVKEKEHEVKSQKHVSVKKEPELHEDCETGVNLALVKEEQSDVKPVLGKTEDSVIYANDPIKKIVTGVPWMDKRKGKGKTSKGKGKGRQIAPVEKLVKAKPKPVVKHSIGVVNLSESDSDSSES